MDQFFEDSAHVIGEYREADSGIIKRVENRSNPWKIMIRNPKKWVINRSGFDMGSTNMQMNEEVNTKLLSKIRERFPVNEDAYSVQCNMYFKSNQMLSFNQNGSAAIAYEVALKYQNEEGITRKLTKKNAAIVQNMNYSNTSKNATVSVQNNSIVRDNNDEIEVSADLVVQL